jgi:hypothetical protein
LRSRPLTIAIYKMPGTNYGGRSFAELREQLFTYIEHYYPDLLSDFSDGATGTMLVELLAAAVEGLEFRLDRSFQETQRGQAQQRSSLLAIAENLGVRVVGRRAAVTMAEFTVTVPVAGDSYDTDYTPRLLAGAQLIGGGRTFETVADIDFNSLYSATGVPNQVLIPRFDAGGRVLSYDITKSEIVVNGLTRTYKTIISSTQAKPFYRLVLPDPDVLSVTKVVNLPGLATGLDVDLLNSADARVFSEVDFLAQDKLFQNDPVRTAQLRGGLVAGHWVPVIYKFLSRYDAYGRQELTFGGGTGDVGPLLDALGGFDAPAGAAIAPYLQSNALGEKILPGSTLVVQYRTGGGVGSNVGPRVLTTMGKAELVFTGTDDAITQQVKRSLRVVNPFPALGGADEPGIEELRQLIGYQHAAKYRAVTLQDYLALVYQLPGRYGAPAKVTAYLDDNIVVLSILGYDATGGLTNQSTSELKQNLAEYLSELRMLNDTVEIRDGRVYHLRYEIEVLSDGKASTSAITTGVAGAVSDFHLPAKAVMGGTQIMAPLLEAINNVPGVINIQRLRVFNVVGNGYSSNQTEQPMLDATTLELDVAKGLLRTGTDGVYALKDALRDVHVTIATLLDA